MMVGLQAYARDLSIPLLFGDGDLVPPGEQELAALVTKLLLKDAHQEVREVRLEHVRYKPHVAITAAYSVRLIAGESSIVTYRAHRGGKWDAYAEEGLPNGYANVPAQPLHRAAILPEEQATLWTFPSDRVLRGAARVGDLRRTARLLDEVGGYAPGVMRLGASRLELLRYKPERRAVFQLRAKLRHAEPGATERWFALRVLPPTEAERVVGFRERLQAVAPDVAVPPLLGKDLKAGILIEPWLDGIPSSPLGFEHRVQAVELLAPLHRIPGTSNEPTRPAPDLAPLFSFQRELHQRVAKLVFPTASAQKCWIHGDFHPDQVLLGERCHLLDWDCLRPGVPEEDLSQWIADELAALPSTPYSAAVVRLMEPYVACGGLAVEPKHLRAWVVRRLAERAASGIQRLQSGAIERAEALVQRAWKLQEGHDQ